MDRFGRRIKGPQSAGANPGPASYGRGGEAPTTTDANLVLGRLGHSLVDGEIQLDRALAERAIEEAIGRPLRLDVEEAAAAMVEVANAKMADALRLVSVRKGYDPREFVLVAFGGAGGLHAAQLARELAIPRVIVPPAPGLLSAMGCLLVDVRHDLSAMFLRAADDASVAELEGAFLALESEARARLEKEGVVSDDMQLTRTIDMRYAGQWRSIPVTVDAPLSKIGPVLATVSRRTRTRARVPQPRRRGRDLPHQRSRRRRDCEAPGRRGTSQQEPIDSDGAHVETRALRARTGVGRIPRVPA